MPDQAIGKFIETMGLIAQADGAPRISGQILGYLLVEGEPRTLPRIAEALRISKGSVSTNARLLEARGLLRRTSPVGSRQAAWEAVSDPDAQLLATLAGKFRHHADAIGEIAGTFPADRAAARARVGRFAEFYRNSADFLDEWRSRLPQEAKGS